MAKKKEAKPKAPKMTEHQAMVLSGVFAVSNMGQDLPKADDLARLNRAPSASVNSSVMYFAREYMECDEHQAMFEDEGRMWYRMLKKQSLAEVAAKHKDIGKLLVAAGMMEAA